MAASDDPASEQTIYRTNLFDCPEQLRRFWKSPDEVEKAFSLPEPVSVTARQEGGAINSVAAHTWRLVNRTGS